MPHEKVSGPSARSQYALSGMPGIILICRKDWLSCHFADMELDAVNTQWTDERIIDLVRKQRNDLIKDFLDERYLKEYIGNKFRIHELSNVVIEFMRKDLKELLISPVNLNHYEPLIRHIGSTDNPVLTDTDLQHFFKEIEFILKRYMYER